MIARGIRNNNPGNVRHGESWQGMAPTQTDSAFIQFQSPEWGIRAIVKILQTYQKHGLTTIAQIISRWAPNTENDTPAYIKNVAWQCGVSPDDPIVLSDCMPTLIEAIIQQENGQQPYTVAEIEKAIALA